LMRPKHSLDWQLTPKTRGVHDLMGSHELFIPSLPPAELQSWR